MAEGGTNLGYLSEFQQAASSVMRPTDPLHPPKHVAWLFGRNIERAWNIPAVWLKEWLVEQHGSLHAISRTQAKLIDKQIDRAASLFMSVAQEDDTRDGEARRATFKALSLDIKKAHERAESL